MPLRASSSSAITSASPAPPQAEVTMARSRRRFGLKMPGVSTNTICASPSMAMPRTSARVVCTLRETMETLEPTREFNRVDLPAFGAPMRATKPAFVPVCSGCSMLFLRPDALFHEKAPRRRLFRNALRRAVSRTRSPHP